ncbi:MAG: alpha-galactosidase [Acidobacteriaceae bacterium]|nr:alpha-galactosidase [Acidobacteriaceae bacterium]
MHRVRFSILLALFAGLLATPAFSDIRFDKRSGDWHLTSGKIDYVLQNSKGVISLVYFGEAGGTAWTPSDPTRSPQTRYDLDGQAEGQAITPTELDLISEKTSSPRPGVDQLILVFHHKRLPLTIEAEYTAWGDTGVFTRALTITNTGTGAIRIERLPALSWDLPQGQYDLTYLWGGGGQERMMANEVLGPGSRRFMTSSGRSTSSFSAWFCIHNQRSSTRYLAQLAYSGNWAMSFDRAPLHDGLKIADAGLHASMGMQFDFGGPLQLNVGESFRLPAVAFTASGGDLDDAANQMHRYQRQYAFKIDAANEPPLVQFNTSFQFNHIFQPFQKQTVANLKQSADLAAKIGAEVYVVDAGWYSNADSWNTKLGDWQPDPAVFPNGMQEFSEYVRKLGMKFGLWVEIETVTTDSQLFHEHPDWYLQYNGEPIAWGPQGTRRHLDFSKPEVRAWARSVIDRLVKDYGIEWFKIDYNTEIGNDFDPAATDTRRADVLYRHLTSYYSWLDEIRSAHPGLIVEACASGGMRFDLGIMAHADTEWLSDESRPKQSLQLAYGCTVEFTPGVCNHWMVGDDKDAVVLPQDTPRWWDFMFRVPMNGQFGISSKTFLWPPELMRRATENVALYKRIREVIANGDAYHLTPQPDNVKPVGWMAVQYVATPARSVLLAYRMEDDNLTRTFSLRGLDPSARYHISGEQQAAQDLTGKVLMEKGISVTLGEPWSATILELQQIAQ